MAQQRKMYNIAGKPMPNMGRLVADKMAERRITKSELGRRMDVSPGVISQYFKQTTLHAAMLWKLGQALNYNFFAVLAAEHPVSAATALEISLQQQLDAVKKELDIYKEIVMGRRE